jgi:WD40 repeat protein
MMSASLVRVLIATTEGPREIESLDKAGLKSSAVCSADKTREIPNFSDSYHRFVSRPTGGVIGGLYGHDYFHLVVSDSIDAGESWQLGVFIAHALHAAGRLSQRRSSEPDQADTVVFATGAVDTRDLSVRSVGAVERKLTKALQILGQAVEAGRQAIAIWPSANREDAAEKIAELRRLGVQCVEVETVKAALATFGLELSDAVISQIRRGWTGSPFRGLEPFDSEHRAIFFGRGRAREDALEGLRVAAGRGCAFLLVHGASGAGKSSLARAGLLGDVAQLTSEADKWRRAIVTPSRGYALPTLALADALIGAAPELKLGHEALADAILEQTAGAAAAVTTALARAQDGRQVKLVVLVDQLEQLFLSGQDEAGQDAVRQREAFAEMLARLARSGVVWVVATMRTDLLTLLENSPVLSRLAANGVEYRLERPNPEELLEIVLRPAELAGMKFEGHNAAGLPLQHILVEAAARAPDCLPLLEFVLDRLYKEEGCRTGALRFEVYDKRIGRFEGAIGRLANDVINALGEDPETVRAVEDVLLQLGRLDRDSGAVVARTAVLDAEFAEPTRARVVEALVEARLVVRDTADGGPTARVAHDAVLTHWERARTLFEDNRTAVALRDRLEDDAARSKEDASLIPAGRRLEEARGLLSNSRIELSREAQAYIRASIAKAEAEAEAERLRLRREATKERRLRNVAVLVAAMLLALAALAGWFAVDATRKRDALEQSNRDLAVEQKRTDAERDKVRGASDAAARSQARFLTALGAQIAASGDGATGMLYAMQILPDDARKFNAAGCEPRSIDDESCWEKFAGEIKALEAPLNLLSDGLKQLRERAVFPLGWGLSLSDLEDCKLNPMVSDDHGAPTRLNLLMMTAVASISIKNIPIGNRNVLRSGDRDDLASANYSADGGLIVTRSGDGDQVGVWDAAGGAPLQHFTYPGPVRASVFSPKPGDDRLFMVAGGEIHISNARATECPIVFQPGGSVHSVAVSPDGRLLAVALAPPGLSPTVSVTKRFDGRGWAIVDQPAGFGKVAILDSVNGTTLTDIPEKMPVFSVAFDPKPAKRRILTVSVDEVHIWDLDHLNSPLKLPHVDVFAAAFSPDGRWVLTTDADATRLWDAEQGTLAYVSERGTKTDPAPGTQVVEPLIGCLEPRPILPLPHDCPRAPVSLVGEIDAAFSADGTRALMVGAAERHLVADPMWGGEGYGRLDIVDLKTKQIAFRHDLRGPWMSAALSPDGKHVAIADSNGQLRVWSPDDDKEIMLAGHDKEIEMASFSPDSRGVVTASDDKTARLWQVAVDPAPWDPLAFGPNLRNPFDIWRLIDSAKEVLPRCLTPFQRQKAFLDAEPPAWCIEMKKWPYDTSEWSEWLAATRAGEKPALPIGRQ